MSPPSSRANTWCRLKNDVVASTVLALSAPSLALASMLTHVTEFGSTPTFFARAVARGIADLLAGEIVDAADAGTLEPIESLRRVSVDVHHAHGVEALAAEEQHARHVGKAELGLTGAYLLRRSRRAAPGLEVDVEAGLFVETHLLGVEIRRVIAAGDPVEREGEPLRRGLRCAERNERRERGFRDDVHTGLQKSGLRIGARRSPRAAGVITSVSFAMQSGHARETSP